MVVIVETDITRMSFFVDINWSNESEDTRIALITRCIDEMKGDSLENDVLDSLCQTIQARLEKATSRVVVGHFLRLISHLGSFIQPNQTKLVVGFVPSLLRFLEVPNAFGNENETNFIKQTENVMKTLKEIFELWLNNEPDYFPFDASVIFSAVFVFSQFLGDFPCKWISKANSNLASFLLINFSKLLKYDSINALIEAKFNSFMRKLHQKFELNSARLVFVFLVFQTHKNGLIRFALPLIVILGGGHESEDQILAVRCLLHLVSEADSAEVSNQGPLIIEVLSKLQYFQDDLDLVDLNLKAFCTIVPIIHPKVASLPSNNGIKGIDRQCMEVLDKILKDLEYFSTCNSKNDVIKIFFKYLPILMQWMGMRVSAYASRFLPCFIVLSHSEDVNVGKGAVECLCCFMKCCPLRVDQHKMKIMQNLLEVYLRNHDMRDSVLGALQVLLKICGDDFKVVFERFKEVPGCSELLDGF